jgi:hypothetical protein
MKLCTVCQGVGFLTPKKKEMSSLDSLPGMITSRRRRPDGWKMFGPKAHAISLMESMVTCKGDDFLIEGGVHDSPKQHPLVLLHKANSMDGMHAGVTVPQISYPEYPWFPSNKGEQLCNLVGDWRIIQQYLLDFGAHRPTVLKHSKAHGIVGEEIDASELSLSLMYNDIDHYPDPENYFDNVTKKQVRDRYPAFRCYGRFTEDFNQVNTMDIKKFVEEHFEEYKELLSSIEHYKHNLFNNVHNYNRDKIPQYSQRIDLNLGRLFTVIDVYSSNQEEFDKWVEVVKECIKDYQVMRTYLSMVQQISNKMSISKKDYENFKKINYVKEYIKSHDPDEKKPETKFNLDYLQKIERADTYIQKKQLIDNYKFIEQQQKIDDKIFW